MPACSYEMPGWSCEASNIASNGPMGRGGFERYSKDLRDEAQEYKQTISDLEYENNAMRRDHDKMKKTLERLRAELRAAMSQKNAATQQGAERLKAAFE